jgi:hypothetical protein
LIWGSGSLSLHSLGDIDMDAELANGGVDWQHMLVQVENEIARQ